MPPHNTLTQFISALSSRALLSSAASCAPHQLLCHLLTASSSSALLPSAVCCAPNQLFCRCFIVVTTTYFLSADTVQLYCASPSIPMPHMHSSIHQRRRDAYYQHLSRHHFLSILIYTSTSSETSPDIRLAATMGARFHVLAYIVRCFTSITAILCLLYDSTISQS